MKLVRYGPPGREKPGIVDADGNIRDLSEIVPDIAGDALSPKGLAKIRKAPIDKLPLVEGNPRLGACVGGTGNFIAIGLNYSDHAAEAGMAIPKEPIIFNKAPSCIVGPNDDTMIPKASHQARLGGRTRHRHRQRARYLTKAKAIDVVAGYCLCNDVSEREFQIERAGQWTKGKSSRNLRTARTLARHQGRDQGPAGASTCGSTSTAPTPERHHQDHDLRRGISSGAARSSSCSSPAT